MEFGLLDMKKTAKAEETSQIPFARAKSLIGHIRDLIRRPMLKEGIITDKHFDG